MEKKEKAKMKMNVKTIITILIVAAIIVGVFLLVKNASPVVNNNNPGTNASQVAVKDPQASAILSSSDSSEPNDAATSIDSTNVVDSNGLS
jgi:hypothetical protein